MNASPDLRAQIENFADLQPRPHSYRNSPIRGALLTNADLDHLLGLFLLREGAGLHVYATNAIRESAATYLGLTHLLDTFCGATWEEPPTEFAPLSRTGTEDGVLFRAIPLPGKPPPFTQRMDVSGIHSVAYQFRDPVTDGRLLVAPDVAALNQELLEAVDESDAVLFDGTFWSGDELAQVRPGGRTAEQMGHVTIRDCSLELLRKSAASHKIYTHINNTNPILSPGSDERAAVEAAGILVGRDGLEFEV